MKKSLLLWLLVIVATLALASTTDPLTGPIVSWEKFYDRNGKEIPPPAGTDDVSDDSLYFKDYLVLTYLRSSPKTANPNPANRTPFAWQHNQIVPCMSPDGEYVYEALRGNLRRFSTADGSYTDFPLSHPGDSACGTDGRYLYILAGNTVHKYTLDGAYINTTTINVRPFWTAFAVARETVWVSPNMSGATTFYGYACSRFNGGSISHDATWDIGNIGTSSPINIAWDGTYYYLLCGGLSANPFYRFYANRTLYSTGTVAADGRSVMCTWRPTGPGPKVLVAGCYSNPAAIRRLADTLALYNTYFSAYDTIDASHAAPPSARELWDAGYRAILTYSDAAYSDATAWGNMLAQFVELGGGVVVTCFGDHSASGYHPDGAWNPRYTLWNLNTNGFTGATLGTVYEPTHPIMAGVTTVGCGNWRTAATTPMASPYVTRIADWASGNPQCVAYDSSGSRVVYLGFYAGANFITSPNPNTGDWIRQINNALHWAATGSVGPRVLIAGCQDNPNVNKRLADSLAAYTSYFVAFDTLNAHLRTPLSAAALWASGYRAILTFSDYSYSDAAAWGDMLAQFVELGGGVVVTCFGDHSASGYHPDGAWNPRYTLWNLNTNGFTGATLGTVYEPTHPIMAGVTTVSCGNWRTAATTPMASPYVTRIADWASGNLQCVAYDSSGSRVVYLGFYAGANFITSPNPNTGDWIRQLSNALHWAAGCSTSAIADQPASKPAFRIWPNPVRGRLNLALGRAANSANVQLFDITGRSVLGRTLTTEERTGITTLDLGELPSGIYLLKLTTDGTTTSQKLVVQR